MRISPKTRCALRGGVAFHCAIIGVIACADETSGYNLFQDFSVWWWAFFIWNFAYSLFVLLIDGLYPDFFTRFIHEEYAAAVALAMIVVVGSMQWALIFAGARKLWDRRKTTQGSRLYIQQGS